MPCSLAVRSDRRLLRRLLQNLVSNAIKYTPEGRVLVGCRRAAGDCASRSTTPGSAFPQSKQRTIFREFHRLDQGAKVARGLGLGLSIVERIARVLDHHIDLRSTPGRGSRFSVEVPRRARCRSSQPRARAAPRRSRPARRHRRCSASTTSRKVLDGMETLLGGWGCRVLKAPDLAAALAAIAEAQPRPTGCWSTTTSTSGNGIEAIAALRRRFGADLPAILITADRSPRCARRRARTTSRCSTSRSSPRRCAR